MEFRHRKSDGGTHALDLVELSFFDDDGNRMVARLFGRCRQAFETVRQDDTGGEALPDIGGDIAFNDGFIALRLMLFRRRNTVGPGTVVGQKQKARRIFIQPAHGKQSAA